MNLNPKSWRLNPQCLLSSHSGARGRIVEGKRHENEACHIVTHIRMSHVTRKNESCYTQEWVMLHARMSHVTHMNESSHAVAHGAELWREEETHTFFVRKHENVSFHTYEWVMSHVWMSHVTHMNGSCQTYEWVMSHIRMRHVTRMNESCHTYERWTMLHHSQHTSLIWLLDMTNSYVWHDSFIRVTWLLHTCDMTQHMNDWQCCAISSTHAHLGRMAEGTKKRCREYCDSRTSRHTYVNESCHTYEWVTSHTYESITAMGWLWLVDSLKL